MKIMSTFLLVAAGLLTASVASAVDLRWSGTNCFYMDSNFYICKPDDKWDTQKTEEANRPVKLVYHKEHANPVIWIIYDDMASSSSASDYASKVRSRYESRGLKDITVTKETVGGRDVYLVTGHDEGKGARFSAALFWKSGLNKALQLEYTAADVDFSTYQPQFMTAISSVRDTR
jgi:hypothetical protein